ncbi:MAG: hypothetical protein Q7S83_00530 [bacterium]|nr:hypothetical protein [bacterium]
MLLKIFVVAFLINVIWEFSHCWLYATIQKMKGEDIVKLLLKMSVKDGVWISIFYLITYAVFQNLNPWDNWMQVAIFAVIALMFAFIDEKISVTMGRWEYGPKMPLVYGVGLTPLLELAVTGLLTFWVVTSF